MNDHLHFVKTSAKMCAKKLDQQDTSINDAMEDLVERKTASPPTKLANLDMSACQLEDSSLSPQTPSSMYSRSVLEGSRGCIVHSILLSYWDNILGPRIRHLWQTDCTSHLPTRDTLNYIASHTLSGEICRDPTDSHVDTKFYVVRERGVVVTAFVFGAMERGELGVHSLSLLVSHSELRHYLHWQELSAAWIGRGVARLRVLLEKEASDSPIEKFTPFLKDFVQMMKTLRESGLPQNIPLCDSAFHPQHHFDGALLCRAITSHLMTCGRSVVIGQSAGRINLMLAALAMFLSPTEKYCCRYVSADQSEQYTPELCVQGLIQEENPSILPPSLHDIYLSRYPTTLIDLTAEEVRHCCLSHDHHRKHHQTRKQELLSLWQGQDTQGYYNGELFYTFDDPETLVQDLLEEMSLLPTTEGIRETFVQQFVQKLERKALSLIKYVQTESKSGKIPMRGQLKRLKHDLGLTVPGDFYIVLATAEKLRPGMYAFLMSDPKVEEEYQKSVFNAF